MLVQNTDQALAVCRELVAEENVQSVLLCPGNTHHDVAQIAAALGDKVSVSVARGDSRSMRVAAKAMEGAGWFSQTGVAVDPPSRTPEHGRRSPSG